MLTPPPMEEEEVFLLLGLFYQCGKRSLEGSSVSIAKIANMSQVHV